MFSIKRIWFVPMFVLVIHPSEECSSSPGARTPEDAGGSASTPNITDCTEQCSTDNKPVCGSNRKTYGNECIFDIAKCRANANGTDLSVAYQGECLKGNIVKASSIDPPLAGFEWNEFVAAELNGQVVIWGGHNGNADDPFPEENIYVYSPDSESWETKIAKGTTIPTHTLGCAGVVLNDILYIFGGGNSYDGVTSDIFSLNVKTSDFQRLVDQKGELPTKRKSAQGWTYGNKLYFIGGVNGDTEKTDGYFGSFDPSENTWSTFVANGDGPGTLKLYAVAVAENRVFIHGGKTDEFPYPKQSSMYVLDMEKKEWTTLEGEGAPERSGHALTPISETRFLVSGGKDNVSIFESTNSTWSEVEKFPDDDDTETALDTSRAVAVKTKNGLSVFCLGNQMYVIDIE